MAGQCITSIGMADETQRLCELIEVYKATAYRVRLNDDHWHTLMIGTPATTLESRLPQIERFGWITAWNPRSIARPKPENQRADHDLQQAVDALEVPRWYSEATPDDRRWLEPGWLLGNVSTGSLERLAIRFGQLGVLHWRREMPVTLRIMLLDQ